jgi:hypothetical protein
MTAKIKNNDNASKDEEKLDLSNIVGRNAKWHGFSVILENSMAVSCRTSTQLSNHAPLKRSENAHPQKSEQMWLKEVLWQPHMETAKCSWIGEFPDI